MHDESFWRDREKSLERRATPVDGGFIIARIDGRAFHTLTRGYDKPFDNRIVAAMESATRTATDAIPGCAIAYWQSDEISLVFPFHMPRKESSDPMNGIPFGGRVEKIASVLASAASVGFDRGLDNDSHVPTFDCRAFVADDTSQLREYLDWRIADSRKNAISTAAWAEFGHSRLLNVSTAKRRQMLVGTKYESMPDEYLYGSIMMKLPVREHVEWVDKRDGTVHETDVVRHRWTSMAATDKNVGRAISTLLPTDAES